MASSIDPVELARVLSEIASSTSDPGTAIRILEVANELLEAAGLGDDLDIPERPPQKEGSCGEPHGACQ